MTDAEKLQEIRWIIDHWKHPPGIPAFDVLRFQDHMARDVIERVGKITDER